MARSNDSGDSANLITRWLVWLRRLRPVQPVDDRPEPRPGRGTDAERVRVQIGVIRRALDGVAAAASQGPSRAKDDAEADYLFRSDHALVRADRLRDVERYLSDRKGDFDDFGGELKRVAEPVEGVVLVRMPRRKDEADSVLVTLEEIERALPADDDRVPLASPDHVVYVTARAAYCPATEPEMTRSRTPWPPAATVDKKIPDGDKVRVAVVDTGLWKDAVGSAVTPWLEFDDVFADTEDLEHVNPAAIHPYAGHGTFIAGIIECLAAETHIDVEGALPHGGAVYESDLCRQLHDALTENRPQIVSMSAGTHTRGGHPMLGFVLLAQHHKLDENDDVLIVAAAGNDASTEPFWPAAFSTMYPWVVSVGSVDPDATVSDFSNHGKSWVSVYARGRDTINAFPTGTYTCYEPPNVGQVRTFKGLAQWSGTSFSTPIVTGLIAAHMRDHGTSARAAWAEVLATATTVHDSRIGEDIKVVGPLT